MGTLVMVGQLILSLSILIVLHEGGHFFPAKWFGTRVEKFYLFFDPWFELFKFKHGETEYGIGWLPFGGYVKISGMIDESFDTEQLDQEPQPWEFRSKPAWQRLIIMLGGVTVNFILGLMIFIGILFYYGEEYLPSENVVHGVWVDSLGTSIGLEDGDKILKLGDMPFDKFDQGLFKKEIIINQVKELTINRNGQEQQLKLPEGIAAIVSSKANRSYPIFQERFHFIVKQPQKGRPAEKAGMLPNDRVVGMNGKSMPYAHEFMMALTELKDQDITLDVIRDGNNIPIKLHTTVDGKIGVELKRSYELLGSKKINYGFAESIPLGIKKGWGALADQATAIGQMIKGKISAKDNLGSVFTIAKAYGEVWDWYKFWTLTGTLSLLLAFLNLLPIPALDGGHVMFLLYEVISGRKPSDKVVEYATIAGFLLLVCLMVFILGLDIWNNFIR